MRLHTYAAAMWQTMFTMYCAASLHDIGISQRANPVQRGSTCIVAGDAVSLHDIGISQRANPVQNGSTCIVAGDAAGRACKSVTQQEEPAKARRSRKSLQKRCEQEEPAKVCRSRKSLQTRGAAGRACPSVAQYKSLDKHGVQKKITLSIIEPVSPQTQAMNGHLKTTKRDPGSMEITKTEGLLHFD